MTDNEDSEKRANDLLEEVLPIAKSEEEALPSFPLEALPERVRRIVEATNKALQFPKDFTACSLLFAASLGIGNTFRVQVKKGWVEPATTYFALVAPTGANKTHPLRFALQPFFHADDALYHQYLKELKEFRRINKMGKEEKKKKGIEEEPDFPALKQWLADDATPEATAAIAATNKRGIGRYKDELHGWVGNFDRYHEGSEQEFWLSVWSGIPVQVNRKTQDPLRIAVPFIGVAGTLQPSVLNKFQADGRSDNGFLHRILFSFPEGLKKQPIQEGELPDETAQERDEILGSLMGLTPLLDDNGNPQPTLAKFSQDSWDCFLSWQHGIAEATNREEDPAKKGVLSKLENHCARLALILQLLRWACNDTTTRYSIELETVEGAIKIAEYFRNHAFRVHDTTNRGDPLETLTETEQKFFESLPDSFKTGEAVDTACRIGIKERTAKEFLRRFTGYKGLFRKAQRGCYVKNL